MKILLILSVFISGCVCNYHGIKYTSYDDTITLPLMAFEDNSSEKCEAIYLICIASYTSEKKTKYRLLVKFPDKTMKMIECSPKNIFIKYGNKCSITASMHGLINNHWYDEVIIEIPKNSIKFENILDGK